MGEFICRQHAGGTERDLDLHQGLAGKHGTDDRDRKSRNAGDNAGGPR
jgi:hypothetical protein